MKKRCAVFHGAGQSFEIREYEVLPPEPGSVGLTLLSSGICGTDVHIHQGRLAMPDFPLIIGHEFIGRVDALGPDAETDARGNALHPGDNVVACVAVPCGKCFNCRRGESASCLAFGVTYARNVTEAPYFHGGFAEYLFSPAKNLLRIPDGVDPFAAAAFPCGGPTVIRACAYGGGLKEDEIVVIQGNGSLGFFALAWAKAHNCRTVVIGSTANAQRTALTRKLAPDFFFDYRTDAPEKIKEEIVAFAAKLHRGDGADVVIETSGAPNAFPSGLTLLRTRGRYFVPGQYSDRGPAEIPPHLITFRALQIFGSGQYTMDDLETYLEFLQAHPQWQEIFRQLIGKYPVSDADRAVADAAAGRVIKAVFAEI